MENQRPKLELPINSPQLLELAFDNPITGESKYGPYYCYTFKDSQKNEFSFFAPEKIHAVLKDQVKGAKIRLTKIAFEKNKKLIQDYEVEIINGKKNGKSTEPVKLKNEEYKVEVVTDDKNNGTAVSEEPKEVTHLDIMKQCFADAAEIQKEYNSVNLNQIAVTLYISKVSKNGNGGSYDRT